MQPNYTNIELSQRLDQQNRQTIHSCRSTVVCLKEFYHRPHSHRISSVYVNPKFSTYLGTLENKLGVQTFKKSN